MIAIFPPPPVQGLGTIGGFKLQVEDRTDQGYEALDQAMKTIQAKARKTPELAGVFSSFNINVPQLYADLDRTKAHAAGRRRAGRVRHHADLSGLALCQRLQPLRPHLRGDRPGRHAVPLARRTISCACRPATSTGEMVPLGAIVRRHAKPPAPTAPCATTASAPPISTAAPAPGYSTGQAQAAITEDPRTRPCPRA